MSTHLVVGYGTLLYRASLGDSIGDDSVRHKAMVPVLVLETKRLFNLRPTHYESSHVLSERGNENAAMNVEPAAGCTVNGLAFTATDAELGVLDRRERYYQRQAVPLLDFATGEAMGKGFIYMAAGNAPWLERDPAKLLPLWRDIEWARAGACAIGGEFSRHFDATTYLADGKTLVVDHYRHRIESVSQSEHASDHG